MGNYLKMTITDKENLCQNIFMEELVKSSYYLKSYEKYAMIGKKRIPLTCYINFRDALFHFRKLSECLEEHEIMQQTYAIKEHLGRARADARTTVLTYFSRVSAQLLEDASIKDAIKPKLRSSFHKMENVVMASRIAGMVMTENSVRKVKEEEVDEILKDLFDLFQDELFEQFETVNDNIKFEHSFC